MLLSFIISNFFLLSLTSVIDISTYIIRGIFMEDHIPKKAKVCLPGSKLLSDIYWMWSSMKIHLLVQNYCF